MQMQARHHEVMEVWAKNNLPKLPIGIGIATGEVIVGNFGSRVHAEYSAIFSYHHVCLEPTLLPNLLIPEYGQLGAYDGSAIESLP